MFPFKYHWKIWNYNSTSSFLHLSLGYCEEIIVEPLASNYIYCYLLPSCQNLVVPKHVCLSQFCPKPCLSFTILILSYQSPKALSVCPCANYIVDQNWIEIIESSKYCKRVATVHICLCITQFVFRLGQMKQSRFSRTFVYLMQEFNSFWILALYLFRKDTWQNYELPKWYVKYTHVILKTRLITQQFRLNTLLSCLRFRYVQEYNFF